MNKLFIKSKNHISNQKIKYIFLLIILIVGIISGISFIFFITEKDKLLVEKEIDTIINIINNKELNILNTFKNSISTNLLYLITIYILSISIIGVPIIILLLFFKGFIFGFSISSIISSYNFKGILISISYLFPEHIILLIIYILLSFHALSFSIRLFRYLFFKENIRLSYYFKNLNKIFIFSLIIIVICSLLETFLTPFLIDLCI